MVLGSVKIRPLSHKLICESLNCNNDVNSQMCWRDLFSAHDDRGKRSSSFLSFVLLLSFFATTLLSYPLYLLPTNNRVM